MHPSCFFEGLRFMPYCYVLIFLNIPSSRTFLGWSPFLGTVRQRSLSPTTATTGSPSRRWQTDDHDTQLFLPQVKYDLCLRRVVQEGCLRSLLGSRIKIALVGCPGFRFDRFTSHCSLFHLRRRIRHLSLKVYGVCHIVNIAISFEHHKFAFFLNMIIK